MCLSVYIDAVSMLLVVLLLLLLWHVMRLLADDIQLLHFIWFVIGLYCIYFMMGPAVSFLYFEPIEMLA